MAWHRRIPGSFWTRFMRRIDVGSRPALISLLLLAAHAAAPPAWSAEVIPAVAQRFAPGEVQEVPDFRRHLIPLLGRLGCNGRTCHGSFQGQGGFRLSLFGYDFQADHVALTGGDEPRANVKTPTESLMLYKPTHPDEHGGGERFKPGSWEQHLIRRWIEAGAHGVPEGDSATVKLEITPAEIVFASTGDQAALRVLAHWLDGSVEDVTPLCRYQTNDESI